MDEQRDGFGMAGGRVPEENGKTRRWGQSSKSVFLLALLKLLCSKLSASWPKQTPTLCQLTPGTFTDSARGEVYHPRCWQQQTAKGGEVFLLFLGIILQIPRYEDWKRALIPP